MNCPNGWPLDFSAEDSATSGMLFAVVTDFSRHAPCHFPRS